MIGTATRAFARRWECTIEEYHADRTAISHSGLDLILEDPAQYEWKVLRGHREEGKKEHFEEGQRFEDALFGDDGQIGSNAVLIPPDVLTAAGAKAGKKWEAFAAEHAGKVLLKSGDPFFHMLEHVRRHDAARELLEAEGEKQATIVWRNAQHGVDCRCRFDYLHHGAEVAVDLKTTRTQATLRDCANECAKWGYHRQAALYIDGAEAMYGVRPHFVFLFVSKSAPYRVETFELDDEFLRLGREQNDEALATYAECLKSGEWRPRSHGRIHRVSPPSWLRYSSDWSV